MICVAGNIDIKSPKFAENPGFYEYPQIHTMIRMGFSVYFLYSIPSRIQGDQGMYLDKSERSATMFFSIFST